MIASVFFEVSQAIWRRASIGHCNWCGDCLLSFLAIRGSRAGFEVCGLGLVTSHWIMNWCILLLSVDSVLCPESPNQMWVNSCLYELYSHLLQLRKSTTIIGGDMRHFFNVSVPFSSRAGIVGSVSSLSTAFLRRYFFYHCWWSLLLDESGSLNSFLEFIGDVIKKTSAPVLQKYKGAN